MPNTSYEVKHAEDNTIYMSHFENSFPHKLYLNMRETFWHNQLRICKENDVNHNMYSDNESNNFTPIRRQQSPDHPAGSFSLMIPENQLEAQTEGINSNTITERSQVIPMNMDIATQFNNEMKITIKQDSNDSSIINIKFGGPIHGNVEGTGNMPKSSFKSLMQNKTIKDETGASIKKDKENQSVVSNVNAETIDSTRKPAKKSSFGSEESINYFASTLPSETVIKNQKGKNKGMVTQNVITSSEVVSHRNASTDQLPVTNDVASTQATWGEYQAPFTQQTTTMSNFPSASLVSPAIQTGETPAVLPKCIIRRITRAMVNDLSLMKKVKSKVYELENKINLLKFEPKILNQNWHAAIKRGKLMIGEIIELIITVNIDKTLKNIEDINKVLGDLKSELINSTFFLLSSTDNNQVNDILCLQLIVDIVREEIDKLQILAEDWVRSGCQTDFSTFFINKFSALISPMNSELAGNDSRGVDRSEADDVSRSNVNYSETQSKTGSQYPPTSRSGTTNQKTMALQSTMNERSYASKDDNNVIEKNPVFFSDPSIITNSRVKKTVNGIMESAFANKLSNQDLTKTYRNNALTIEIINDRPLIKMDNNMSLIKELISQQERWNAPILTGKTSIQDLIEFIINTLSQNQESNKHIYDEVVEELIQLEKELMFSVTNNLYMSRYSDADLMTLCYELLAEIILNEISIAKYIFNALDRETITAASYPLGKLYRNYIGQTNKIPENTLRSLSSNISEHLLSQPENVPGNAIRFHSSDFSEHLVSQPANVPGNAIRFHSPNISEHISQTTNVPFNALRTHSSNISEQFVSPKSEIRNNTDANVTFTEPENYSVTEETRAFETDKTKPLASVRDSENYSKQSDGLHDYPTLTTKASNDFNQGGTTQTFTKDLVSKQSNISKNENEALFIIIDKLNNQTKEINKIKDNLQTLTGKVDEKFGTWTCNFSLDKVNDYCQVNEPVRYADTSKMFNSQEVINPGDNNATIVQPSYHTLANKVYSRATTNESASFVAPISNHTSEQSIGRVNKPRTDSGTLNSDDVLNLIASGAHNLLMTSKKSRDIENLSRRDSCREMNIEFDKVFQWVVDKYHEEINEMLKTPEGSQFVENMNILPEEERRKIEKDLIGKIVNGNNIMIHSWMKEICYKRLLNCLTPAVSK